MNDNVEIKSVVNSGEEPMLSSLVSDVADETAMEVLKSLASAETTIFGKIKAILSRVGVKQTPDDIVEALAKGRNDLLKTIDSPSIKTSKGSDFVVPKAANDNEDISKAA